MAKNAGKDLTQGPIYKQLISFAIPVILTSVMQQLYTSADEIIVGKFAGDVALAAVGSTSHITNLLLNLFVGLSVGATVTCAKHYGAKDRERVSNAVHTSITLALLSGLFISIVGVLISRPVLAMMDTPADVINHSVTYMRIRFSGMVFTMTYNFGAGILRASGEAKKPLYILMVTGVINVLLNMLFVICFDMAEAGVALATIISSCINAISVLVILSKREDDMRLDFKRLKFHRDELINIIRVGVPSGLNSIMFNIANITLQSSVNSFGKVYMAASTAASAMSHYISLLLNSLATAMTSFVGQNYGAKKFKRIHKSVLGGCVISLVATGVIVGIIQSFPRFFLGMFTNNPEVVDAGVIKLTILSFGMLLHTPGAILSGAMRGLERPNVPFIINVITTLGLRLLWVWFIFPLKKTFAMLFLVYPISWAALSAVLVVVYVFIKRKFPAEE